jgi:hypothetical protein
MATPKRVALLLLAVVVAAAGGTLKLVLVAGQDLCASRAVTSDGEAFYKFMSWYLCLIVGSFIFADGAQLRPPSACPRLTLPTRCSFISNQADGWNSSPLALMSSCVNRSGLRTFAYQVCAIHVNLSGTRAN